MEIRTGLLGTFVVAAAWLYSPTPACAQSAVFQVAPIPPVTDSREDAARSMWRVAGVYVRHGFGVLLTNEHPFHYDVRIGVSSVYREAGKYFPEDNRVRPIIRGDVGYAYTDYAGGAGHTFGAGLGLGIASPYFFLVTEAALLIGTAHNQLAAGPRFTLRASYSNLIGLDLAYQYRWTPSGPLGEALFMVVIDPATVGIEILVRLNIIRRPHL